TSYSEIGRHPAASKRLSPIQDWFFNAHVDSPWHHFNQGLVLELSPAIDERRLAQAWRLLGQRHPMLRSRFVRSGDGVWQRHVGSAWIDLKEAPRLDRADWREAVARHQASF